MLIIDALKPLKRYKSAKFISRNRNKQYRSKHSKKTSKMKSILVICALCVLVTGDVINLNSEIDEMLDVIRHELKISNESEIALPDIALAYTKNVYFIPFRFELNGTDGTVKNLTTVKRKNNITVVSSEDSLFVILEFGFNDLHITYNYFAKFFWLHVGGLFQVNISDNSVAIELGINMTTDHCSGVIDVKDITFTMFQGVEVQISGFGVMNRLMSAFVSNSLLEISTSVKSSIEDIFTEKLQENLKTFNICGSETKKNLSKFLSTNVANLSAPNFINMILNQSSDVDKIVDTV